MNKPRSILRKVSKIALYGVYLVVICLLLFEVVYRYQWIDFYSSEFETLNANLPDKSDGDQKTILICGDSFTADPNGWVSKLQKDFPDHRFVNAAVPGTGIDETLIIAPDRISEYKPDVFIYQLYVGNDLLDIDHPTNWGELPFMRNVYWSFADVFLSLRVLNYKIGQATHHFDRDIEKYEPKTDSIFEPSKYNAREKMYWKAEPGYFENAAMVSPDHLDDFQFLLEGLEELRTQLPTGCKMIVIAVPHAAQVNETQFNSMQHIFPDFPINSTKAQWLEDENYPFQFGLQQYAKLRSNVAVIDLLQFLRYVDAPDKPLYYVNDPHFTDNGHHFMAFAVARQLRYDFRWPYPEEQE